MTGWGRWAAALAAAGAAASGQANAAEPLVAAVTGGKPLLEMRLRYEGVDQAGFAKDAAAEKHVPDVTREGNVLRVRVGSVEHPMLPEHHTGWVGRPGLSGSRGGRAWSPKFVVNGIEADGVPVPPAGRPIVQLAEARVEVGHAGRDLGDDLGPRHPLERLVPAGVAHVAGVEPDLPERDPRRTELWPGEELRPDGRDLERGHGR